MMKSMIGKEVLEVYRKSSPSAIGIEKKDYREKFFTCQKELWQNRLKIPLRALRDAKIFDFGCGTGEVDMFLAANKAYVKGVDFNPDSIKRARYLAKRFKSEDRLNFQVGDIHKKLFQDNAADFVMSIGVLPHVADPEKVFANMVKASKKDAFVIVGFVEELGIVQRLLHRSIIRAVAGFNEKKIMEFARQAFPDHLRRSKIYGLRTECSVVYDYLVNRHMYGLPLERVIDWFKRQGVSYYSSWPSIDLPFEVNPYTSSRLYLSHPMLKEYRSLLRLRWLFTQYEDQHVFGNIAGLLHDKMLYKYVDQFSKKLTALLQNQGEWPEKDLIAAQSIGKKIVNSLDDSYVVFGKVLHDHLAVKMGDLSQVLRKILKLQEKSSGDYRLPVNLFKELNGLGTLYLAAVKDKGSRR